MTTTALTTRENELTLWADAGQQANEAAAASAFTDYRVRMAPNTVQRQDAGLALFGDYLTEATGIVVGDLATDPNAWRGITWGMVDGFVKWLLLRGFAIGTINVRLSTVKTYAKLAAKAGTLATETLAMIRLVSGYSRKGAKNADERRGDIGVPTRLGGKKAGPVALSKTQADALKERPDTPQGRRDAVLVGLMLDLGLRVGEVAGLTVGNVDLKRGELTFYRPKVDKTQIHGLVNGLQAAMADYIEKDALAVGPLLRASNRGGWLTHAGMTERGITDRVRHLGHQVGIEGLSAHDLRHAWATLAARAGTPLERLREAGGWNSLAMPSRYIEAAKIANEGVRL